MSVKIEEEEKKKPVKQNKAEARRTCINTLQLRYVLTNVPLQ